MKLAITLSFLMLLMSCSHLARKKPTLDQPHFILFPGLHKLFLDSSWKFSLSDLLGSIQTEHLDALCVEIAPADFNEEFEGYYPPEAAAVAEVFSKTMKIIPTDWRASYSDYKEPSAQTLNRITVLKEEFNSNLNQATDRIKFVLSTQGEAQIKMIHETIINQNGQEADGFWISRNKIIAETCLKKSIEGKFNRVGMVFGIDHLYAIKEVLISRGFEVSYATLNFSNEKKIPHAIIQRWHKNLIALRKMRDAKNRALQIEQSGRLDDLVRFIKNESK